MRRLIPLVAILILSSFTYATIPSGYYSSINGKQTSTLKTELHNILMVDTSRYYSYGSGANHTWNGFYYTDRDTTNNLVIDMYSDSLRYFTTDYISQGYPGFGSKIHIEHSLPKSWWNSHEWAAYKDLNQLFPADGGMNLSKSDNPLGIVTGTPTKDNGVSKSGPAVYPDYTGNVFEPDDQYKGDFARTYFYMATAYEHYKNLWDTTKPENMMQNNSYPVFKTWAVQMLLQWHRQDPVSTKELTRNEKVYSIQGNRNPFIDYPELVEYIWGNKVGQAWQFTTSTLSSKQKTEYKIKFNNNQDCFSFNTDATFPITYAIYNVDGRKVLQGISYSNNQIRIPKLKIGYYIFEINYENQTFKQQYKILHD